MVVVGVVRNSTYCVTLETTGQTVLLLLGVFEFSCAIIGLGIRKTILSSWFLCNG